MVSPAKAPPNSTNITATPRYTQRFGSSGDLGASSSSNIFTPLCHIPSGAALAIGSSRSRANPSTTGLTVPNPRAFREAAVLYGCAVPLLLNVDMCLIA